VSGRGTFSCQLFMGMLGPSSKAEEPDHDYQRESRNICRFEWLSLIADSFLGAGD
jgi:hypothetical protein